MNIMKPNASEQIPTGTEWVYEVKYDGFRCVLHWEKETIRLISRNDTDLTANFPEIIMACLAKQSSIEDSLPLRVDGELVVLNNEYQANFSWIQKRGRLKNKEPIENAAATRPASFMAFDLLEYEGESLVNEEFAERKKKLAVIFDKGQFESLLRYVPFTNDADELWAKVFDYKSEGIVAKRLNSVYGDKKKHNDWFKIKNWRKINGFLTFYNTKNDYFTVCVFDHDEVLSIGKCKHGLDDEESYTLKDLFRSNGAKEGDGFRLPPAICAEINTLDLFKSELREPEFNQILPSMEATDCTLNKLKLDITLPPNIVELTNTDKIFWPQADMTKGDLLVYIREISPYMLPFLKDRRLTVIRCPDGVHKEYFFQKHLPDYAPSFIKSVFIEDEEFFICDSLNSLLWFANHGAVEFHIPFQSADNDTPTEIAFDLDPPDREAFPLAIKAANILKQLLDNLELVSFVKTSGGKGLQIHIPIPNESMTYDQTGVFTQAIAWTIEKEHPDLFTTERLKKNRGDRLYIDYLQHGKDKTLIAPYSPRKRDDATVSAPLFWEEVKEGLTPDSYTIANVVERVKRDGCPFDRYFEVGKTQVMDKILGLVVR
ncbi:bifunctional non-homologous end joining protein LigD [Virgibacillus salinus]|uniref:DNA ligase (ATP) n=2 Tax=Virgibacillus salinus TaxID=553311 RepID=A0A1H0YAA3_9BACI|nr:bifunctional non-homologous end joining protein LigD [Virgibacillus salinus]